MRELREKRKLRELRMSESRSSARLLCNKWLNRLNFDNKNAREEP
jgi:hypothetical protein